MQEKPLHFKVGKIADVRAYFVVIIGVIQQSFNKRQRVVFALLPRQIPRVVDGNSKALGQRFAVAIQPHIPLRIEHDQLFRRAVERVVQLCLLRTQIIGDQAVE